ncbi:MAG: thermonuclease family protein [Patescibacteria group bacterium]
MKFFLISLVIIGLIAPQVTFAAWWNPLTWFKETLPQPALQTQVVNSDSHKVITITNEKSAQKSDLYPVVKVVDGDTLSVNINGTVTTIRLIGINTPETVDPRKSVQCFGKEASNKAKRLLAGQKIRIEKDPSQGERDKYGRLLAYVFFENGLNFNKYMIEEGYAYEYTYNFPYKYQSKFKQAQREAQMQGKGLWAEGVCSTKNTTPTVVPIVGGTTNADTEAIKTPTINITPRATTKSVMPIQTSAPAITGKYICNYNAYNCPNFSTHAEAQAVYEACGGATNDIHRLDQDKDSLACESLP